MNVQAIDEGLQYITYGLYIVSSADDTRQNGMIVNTVFQVSAEPARLAISVNKQSLTHELICKTRVFAAMPLMQETPFAFIGRFGFRTGRNFNKLDGISYQKGRLNCPLINEYTLSYIEVSVGKQVDLGTHTLFIGTVQDSGLFSPDKQPLTYAYYHTVLKGKTPPGATHRG